MGTFTQSGGTNTVNGNSLNVGNATGAVGVYTLSGGSLTINNNEVVGYFGSGTFTQSGGVHNVSGALIVGDQPGGTGSFGLSGGSLAVGTNAAAFSASEIVGEFGAGSFTQSGGSSAIGTAAINQALVIGFGSTGLGNYTLNNAASTLTVNGTRIRRIICQRDERRRDNHPIRRHVQPDGRDPYCHEQPCLGQRRRLYWLVQP